ncbi:MAG: ABC transporter ATP-binding protein [Pseudomonadota bacterium]
MMTQLRQLMMLLGKREKGIGALLLCLILVAALAEVIGVAAVPAFVGVMIDPGKLLEIGFLQHLFDVEALVAWLRDSDKVETVIVGSAILVAIFAAKTAFLVLNFWLQVRFVSARRIEIASRLTRCYLNAPYSFHLERNTAAMLRNVDREAMIIAYAVMGALLEVATRVVILIAVLALLFVIEPWVTLFWMGLFGALGVAGTLLMSRRLKAQGQREQTNRKSFIQALHQGLGTVKEARVLNREAYFQASVDDRVRDIVEASRFKIFTGKTISPITELVAIAGLLTLASALLIIGRAPEAIAVTMSLFVVGLVRLRETMNASLFHLSNLRYNLVSIGPVFDDLMALEGEVGERQAARAEARKLPRRRFEDKVELIDVWHRYAPDAPFSLRGIDITIPKGATIGIVGSTGAGKSTLLDILLGLMRPASGRVLVDGDSIFEPDPSPWQQTIGYVPQSIYLIDDTIRRNIALGLNDDEIDETALARAIRQAQLEDFMRRQPQGLDTVVGERGVRLSGGERQRIGIARALYHDPAVLVLDEATSALDNETERAVVDAVEAGRGRRTVIMIAHRLSTVRNCDRLYMLSEGALVGEGSFDDLLRDNPEFRQMAAPAAQAPAGTTDTA